VTNVFEIESNNNYYLIENSNQLQKILNKILLDKIFIFTQKVNQVFKKIIKFYNLVIDSNK